MIKQLVLACALGLLAGAAAETADEQREAFHRRAGLVQRHNARHHSKFHSRRLEEPADEPVTEAPVTEAPVTEEPEPAADEPAAEEPKDTTARPVTGNNVQFETTEAPHHLDDEEQANNGVAYNPEEEEIIRQGIQYYNGDGAVGEHFAPSGVDMVDNLMSSEDLALSEPATAFREHELKQDNTQTREFQRRMLIPAWGEDMDTSPDNQNYVFGAGVPLYASDVFAAKALMEAESHAYGTDKEQMKFSPKYLFANNLCGVNADHPQDNSGCAALFIESAGEAVDQLGVDATVKQMCDSETLLGTGTKLSDHCPCMCACAPKDQSESEGDMDHQCFRNYRDVPMLCGENPEGCPGQWYKEGRLYGGYTAMPGSALEHCDGKHLDGSRFCDWDLNSDLAKCCKETKEMCSANPKCPEGAYISPKAIENNLECEGYECDWGEDPGGPDIRTEDTKTCCIQNMACEHAAFKSRYNPIKEVGAQGHIKDLPRLCWPQGDRNNGGKGTVLRLPFTAKERNLSRLYCSETDCAYDSNAEPHCCEPLTCDPIENCNPGTEEDPFQYITCQATFDANPTRDACCTSTEGCDADDGIDCSNPVRTKCSLCKKAWFGDECERPCVPIDNVALGSNYAYQCTTHEDTTLINGEGEGDAACEHGFFHNSGGEGTADTCDQCTAVANCQHACGDEPCISCTNDDNSVCAKCAEGFDGSTCQHEIDDSVCNFGGKASVNGEEVACLCDDGRSGAKCETKATCAAADVGSYPGSKVAGGCTADGALDSAQCSFKCLPGHFAVSRSEGMCSADLGAKSASYQGQGITCKACGTIAHCIGIVTCSIDGDVCEPNLRKTDKRRCEAGYHGPQCEACPRGHFTNDKGECKACAPGEYQDLLSASSCKNCPAGRASPSEAAQGCTPCLAGEFSAAEGATECFECPVGKVSRDQGSTKCEACDAGKYAGQNGGSVDCNTCLPVFACAGDVTCTSASDSACSECESGHYISNGYQCSKCSVVEHCNTQCEDVAAVRHEAVKGEADVGKIQMGATKICRPAVTCSGSTDHVCSDCAAGYYTDRQGCSECVQVERCMFGMTECSMGPPLGDSNSICTACEDGWSGETCATRVVDNTCFSYGAYDDDGSYAPDNTGRTAVDFQGCQWQCQAARGKKMKVDGRTALTGEAFTEVGMSGNKETLTVTKIVEDRSGLKDTQAHLVDAKTGKAISGEGHEGFGTLDGTVAKETVDHQVAGSGHMGLHGMCVGQEAAAPPLTSAQCAEKALELVATLQAALDNLTGAATQDPVAIGAATAALEAEQAASSAVWTDYNRTQEKRNGKQLVGGCKFFTYNTETTECRLHEYDAGCGGTSGADREACLDAGKARVKSGDMPEVERFAGFTSKRSGFVAGPKYCYRATCDELYKMQAGASAEELKLERKKKIFEAFDDGHGGVQTFGSGDRADGNSEAVLKGGLTTSQGGQKGVEGAGTVDGRRRAMECPAGWSIDKEHMNRVKSILKCEKEDCTVEDDLETCCNAATCGNWECPAFFVKRLGVDDVVCGEHNGVPHCTAERAMGRGESASDTDTCCEPNAMCITMGNGNDENGMDKSQAAYGTNTEAEQCPQGWVLMSEGTNVADKPCHGAKCTRAADQTHCCEPQASCDEFKCPVHEKEVDAKTGTVRFIDFVLKPDAKDLYCHAKECVNDKRDRNTCCMQRPECESMDCGEGYVRSAHAVATQVACLGAVCTKESDLERCCFRQKHCGTMISNGAGDVCPEGWAEKSEKPEEGGVALDKILCDSSTGFCDPRVDLPTCCNPQETCDEMATELFDCGGLNKFFGEDCDVMCLKDKCDEQPTCAWTVGPPGMWFEYLGGRDEDDQPIGSGACGWKEGHYDWGQVVCPQGTDEYGEVEQMEGGFFKPGMGEEAIKLWGFNAKSATMYEQPCVWHKEQICTESVGDSSVMKEDAADGRMKATSVLNGNMDCVNKFDGAGPKDFEEFSGLKASEKCEGAYSIRPDPTRLFCEQGWCTVEHDQDTCCAKKASCDTFGSHPEEYALKANAADLLCRGTVCSAADEVQPDSSVKRADMDLCCDERALCVEDHVCQPGSYFRGPDSQESVLEAAREHLRELQARAPKTPLGAAEERLAEAEAAQLASEEAGSTATPAEKDKIAAETAAAAAAVEEIIAREEVAGARADLTEAMVGRTTLGEKQAAEAALDVAQAGVAALPSRRRLGEGELATVAELEAADEAIEHAQAAVDAFEAALMCAHGECVLSDELSCCEGCRPGYHSVAGGPCVACATGTRSNAGFGKAGSTNCDACPTGTYSLEAMDHCLDCAPIFGCAAKEGMGSGKANGSTIGGDGSCTDDEGCAVLAMRSGDAMTCLDGKCVFAAVAHADAGSMDAFQHSNADSSLVAGNDESLEAKIENTDGGYVDEALKEELREASVLASVAASGAADAGRRLEGIDLSLSDVVDFGASDITTTRLAEVDLSFDEETRTYGGTTCSGANDVKCDKCIIGYWGTGTSTCTKCDEIPQCGRPRGHKQGPSCTNVGDATLKCGECKAGFFGDLCEACTPARGCAVGHDLCQIGVDTTYCSKCGAGFFITELAAADVPDFHTFQDTVVGTCAACDSIDNCITTSCTGTGGSTCAECRGGFMPIEDVCGELSFDAEAGVWTAEKPSGSPRRPRARTTTAPPTTTTTTTTTTTEAARTQQTPEPGRSRANKEVEDPSK